MSSNQTRRSVRIYCLNGVFLTILPSGSESPKHSSLSRAVPPPHESCLQGGGNGRFVPEDLPSLPRQPRQLHRKSRRFPIYLQLGLSPLRCLRHRQYSGLSTHKPFCTVSLRGSVITAPFRYDEYRSASIISMSPRSS